MKIRAVENFNIATAPPITSIHDFVDRRSIVRPIWSDPNLVLLIFPVRLASRLRRHMVSDLSDSKTYRDAVPAVSQSHTLQAFAIVSRSTIGSALKIRRRRWLI